MDKMYYYSRMTKQFIEKMILIIRHCSLIYCHQPIYGTSQMTKVMKKSQYQMIVHCIQKIFVLLYQDCRIKGINISILIMLWMVGCYVWFLTLGWMSLKTLKINVIFRWILLSRLCFMDPLKNSYLKLSIRSGANIKISIIRLIFSTVMNLSGTVKILLMVTVIYGIENPSYHPPNFLVL